MNRQIARGGGWGPPWRLADWELLPGVVAACGSLAAAGYRLLVVTNQPDVARGALDAGILDEIHARLRSQLPVDEILVCPHDDGDACACRKPQPGMLHTGAKRWNLDLAHCWMVGDRCKDITAGVRAGCRTVLIGAAPDCASDLVAPSLSAAVAAILHLDALAAAARLRGNEARSAVD